jgi:hypothetical protein
MELSTPELVVHIQSQDSNTKSQDSNTKPLSPRAQKQKEYYEQQKNKIKALHLKDKKRNKYIKNTINVMDVLIVLTLLILGIYYASETNDISKIIYIIISIFMIIGCANKIYMFLKSDKSCHDLYKPSKVICKDTDITYGWGIILSFALSVYYVTITVFKFIHGNELTNKREDWLMTKNNIVENLKIVTPKTNYLHISNVIMEHIILNNNIDDFNAHNYGYVYKYIEAIPDNINISNIYSDIKNLQKLHKEYSEIQNKSKSLGFSTTIVNLLLLLAVVYFSTTLLITISELKYSSDKQESKILNNLYNNYRNNKSIMPFNLIEYIYNLSNPK